MPDEIAQFSRIAVPLVRRIYPQLIADKIINVQPLQGPTGLQYYMNFKYSSQQQPQNESWTVKKKKKKIWRDITDPWEITQDGDLE